MNIFLDFILIFVFGLMCAGVGYNIAIPTINSLRGEIKQREDYIEFLRKQIK